jgi:hypothetical protein
MFQCTPTADVREGEVDGETTERAPRSRLKDALPAGLEVSSPKNWWMDPGAADTGQLVRAKRSVRRVFVAAWVTTCVGMTERAAAAARRVPGPRRGGRQVVRLAEVDGKECRHDTAGGHRKQDSGVEM